MDLTHVVLIVDNTPRYEYEGFYNYFWQRHGNGTARFLNGDVYCGHFENGKRHGYGTYTYSNRCSYTGEWLNNLRHGMGKFVNADGSYYEGEWVNDKACGYGCYHYTNGDYYEGQWEHNIRNGRGKYEYAKAKIVWIGKFVRGRRFLRGFIFKSEEAPENWMGYLEKSVFDENKDGENAYELNLLNDLHEMQELFSPDEFQYFDSRSDSLEVKSNST